jgi:hypothetical protein
MWWTIAIIGYCLVCWLIGLLLIRVVRKHSDDDADDDGLAGKVLLALVAVVLLLLSPVVMPYLVWLLVRWQLRCSPRLRQLRTVMRTYRPYEFIPVDVSSLEPSVRERFEAHTPALVDLGFRRLGDFRMKPEPVVVHTRCFLSADSETIADITALLSGGGVSLISVLDDGTVVHTTSVNNPRPERTFEPADQMWVSYVPDASVSYLHFHHANAVRDLSAGTGARAMRFRDDQLKAVLVYDQRIFCRWRYRYGGLDEEPPAPDLQSLRGPQTTVAADADCAVSQM